MQRAQWRVAPSMVIGTAISFEWRRGRSGDRANRARPLNGQRQEFSQVIEEREKVEPKLNRALVDGEADVVPVEHFGGIVDTRSAHAPRAVQVSGARLQTSNTC